LFIILNIGNEVKLKSGLLVIWFIAEKFLKFNYTKLDDDSERKEVRNSEVDKYQCNIESLLRMKRNILIKVSSTGLDEDVVEVLLIFIYILFGWFIFYLFFIH
jgi:hypothetical protein